MRQFVGSVRDDTTVRDLLLGVAPEAIRAAAATLDQAELAMMEADDEKTQLRYAQAVADWGEVGGYDAEVLWDVCTTAALGVPFDRCRWREVKTLSGGEQKRLVLEALLRGPDQVLLLDEPDNYLDVPGKRWLEDQLNATPKTASCWPTPRPGSSRSSWVPPAIPLGLTVADSRRTTRPASIGSSASRNCARSGTTSTRSCARRC